MIVWKALVKDRDAACHQPANSAPAAAPSKPSSKHYYYLHFFMIEAPQWPHVSRALPRGVRTLVDKSPDLSTPFATPLSARTCACLYADVVG